MDILDYTALELSRRIKLGQIGVEEALEAVLERIKIAEEALHCYLTVDEAGARKRAALVQRQIDVGELSGPLAGVPFALKDNICTAGLRTTCASRMLEHFVPGYSAGAVERLGRAGAVVVGKTNMDEFAMGSTSETSYFGPVRNPWNPERVPGGSSGGSAAAVAAGECFAALGSDTGGSVRQPASYCGVVGMKPTYGTVSRRGLIAYASSLDQIGPLTKDVADCAALLEVIAAHDPADATSVERGDTDFTAALTGTAEGLRIGIPRDYFGEGLDPQVGAAVLAAAGELERQGAVLEEFDLGLVDYAVPAYYTIASAEAGSNLERFDGMKYGYRAEGCEGLHQMYKRSRSEGFGAEVKRRIMLGTYVLSAGYYDAYYLKALKVRALIGRAFDEAFSRYDIILGPAAPTTAPRLGVSLSDPLKMYLGDIYTITANLAGHPAVCVPCGADANGLPIGVQLAGAAFQEKKLLQAAFAYERGAGKLPRGRGAAEGKGAQTGRREGAGAGSREGAQAGGREVAEAGRREGAEAGRREGAQAGRREGAEAGRREGAEAGRREGAQAGNREGSGAGRKESVGAGGKESVGAGGKENAEAGRREGAEAGNREGSGAGGKESAGAGGKESAEAVRKECAETGRECVRR